MPLVPIILVVAGVLLYSFYRRWGGESLFGRSNDDLVEIARRRYAEGKISQEGYDQIKEDLERSWEER